MTKRGAAPQILPGYDEWLHAFWKLSTNRNYSMGAGPIPSMAVDAWIDRYLIRDGALFRRCMEVMDGVFVDHVNKPKSKTTYSTREFTPQLFDALMGGK